MSEFKFYRPKGNALVDKSYAFGVKIESLSEELHERRKFNVAGQLGRSGTAIGALSREAQRAESDKDFIHKLNIALKEADETQYWLNLAGDCGYIDKHTHDILFSDCDELIRLLVAIINSKKRKLG